MTQNHQSAHSLILKIKLKNPKQMSNINKNNIPSGSS